MNKIIQFLTVIAAFSALIIASYTFYSLNRYVYIYNSKFEKTGTAFEVIANWKQEIDDKLNK